MPVITHLTRDAVVDLIAEDFSGDSEVIFEIVKDCTDSEELKRVLKYGLEYFWYYGGFQEIEDFIKEMKAEMKEKE